MAVAPTPAQDAVSAAESLSLLVRAPAGCGKTEALAMRLAALVRRGVVCAPRRALVLTFSNKARDNIRARLSDYMGFGATLNRISIVNLHGFAARVVRAHGVLIGIDSEWTFPTSDWVRARCDLLELGFVRTEAVQEVLARVKRQALPDDEVLKALKAEGAYDAVAVELTRVNERQLTYDDLLRHADVLLANKQVADLYSKHFACVVVDEFQDLSLQQLRIVNRVGWRRTTYAGDVGQGIYGFAGAEPVVVLKHILEEVDENISLTTSHRSAPAVLAAVNALAARTGGTSLESADPESWPGGGFVAACVFQHVDDEAAWIVGFARDVLRRAPDQRIGVLVRVRSRRAQLDRRFDASEEVTAHRWDDPLLDAEASLIVRQTLDRIGASGLAAIAKPLAHLRSLAGLELIEEPSTREAVDDALHWIIDEMDRGESANQLRERAAAKPASTLLQAKGVHLLNAHVGKGQQFDWVVIAGLEQGTLPFFKAKTTAALAEEARVLGVMLSRARHGVVLTRSKTLVSERTGRPYPKDEPSEFLSDLRDAGVILTSAEAGDWIESADWDAINAR